MIETKKLKTGAIKATLCGTKKSVTVDNPNEWSDLTHHRQACKALQNSDPEAGYLRPYLGQHKTADVMMWVSVNGGYKC